MCLVVTFKIIYIYIYIKFYNQAETFYALLGINEEFNGCSKSIGLRNNFRNFLWNKKKQIIFLTNFYIFHKNNIKTLAH